MEHPLIVNARQLGGQTYSPMYMDPSNPAPYQKPLAEALTVRILDRIPAIFNDVRWLMSSPSEAIEGHQVTATTYDLPVEYTGYKGVTDEEVVLDKLADELATAIVAAISEVESTGKVVCLYNLVVPQVTGSLIPKATFKIRYGIYDPQAISA